MFRSRSGLAWDSYSAIQPGRSILGVAVIVVLLVEDLWKDFKQDHAMAVSHHDATHIDEELAHHFHGRN